jgi:hypothetical protein
VEEWLEKHRVVERGPRLRELDRVRLVRLDAGEREVEVVTRRNALQAKVLATFGVDTRAWDTARIR